MEEFKKKFKEEATDLIDDLEKSVLSLEANPHDKSLIEKIFRIMHSLKGGGAMFGFDAISEFTHHLESIYDFVRNDKMNVTDQLLGVTLQSVDHIKQLLNEDYDSDKEIQEQNKELSEIIIKIIKNTELNGLIEETDTVQQVESPEKSDDNDNPETKNSSTYYIFFRPNRDILENGTNPLYLIDEIYTMGNSITFAHTEEIPGLDKMQPPECYVYWDIFVETQSDINALYDIFIFIEDECEIDIQKISQQNILNNIEFKQFIESTYKKQKRFDILELKAYVANLKKEENNKNEEKTIRQEKKNEKKTPKYKTKTDTGKTKTMPVKSPNSTNETIISSIRVPSDKIDQLMNLVSELVTTQAGLTLFAEKHKIPGLITISENVENITRQLRDNAFSISLIPLETIIIRFQRLVRDLSRELNKEIAFITEGTDTELDKNIIQSLLDPLLHIVRNSIDHGIEPPDVRQKRGKPGKGTIWLKAFYSGANVNIQVKDDGAGVDIEKIKQKAIERNIISAEESYTDKELLNLIFLPGLTTSQNVTDLSGRGVGMDVVNRKIAEIRGEVDIDTELGKGTAITVKLPLTLSIIDGLLVRIKNTDFIIPLGAVDKIYAARHEELVNTFNNIIVFDGQQIPFYYLREEFAIDGEAPESEEVVIVKYEEKRIGLAIDLVVGEYQAVLKPLGKLYKDQEIFSGASILGDGTVALVMDTNKIIKKLSHSETKA